MRRGLVGGYAEAERVAQAQRDAETRLAYYRSVLDRAEAALAAARKANPYFRSLSQSLRDIWLELRQNEQARRHLEARPGKPNRNALIAVQELDRNLSRLETRLEEVTGEMTDISVFCIDPREGLAAVPFLRGQELAWFIFDLFDEQGISTWRLASDAIEHRRPIAELDTDQPAIPSIPTAAN